jgi:CheY-like chemotaxis protein
MGRARILIADDDPDTLQTYSNLLELAGYEILKATTGQECLRVVREALPDLVLLDVMLPDLSGIDVCKQIKADPELASIFVIHVSGLRVSPKDLADGLESGADGYVPKPVDPRVLLAHIRALLRIKKAEAELAQHQAMELELLRRFSLSSRTAVTAQMYGAMPLSKGLPETFEELVGRYANVMDLALEQRAYKVEYKLSEDLRDLGDRLGFLNVGPRDVVDIHSAALKRRIAGIPGRKAQAYIEEGRLTVLELMGYLVSYYRNYSMGARKPVPPKM